MKPARNILSIKNIPTPDGILYELGGYIETSEGRVRIRESSRDLAAVMQRKNELEAECLLILKSKAAAVASQPTRLPAKRLRVFEDVNDVIPTHLTDEEVRLSLMQWVERFSESKTMTCMSSLSLWEENARLRRRRARTVQDNRNAVLAFLRHHPCELLHELRPEVIEKYVMAPGIAMNTMVTRGSRLRAWLEFCVSKGLLRENPMKVDLDELKDTADKNLHQAPRILTAAQAHRLLAVAREYEGGVMVPYVILSTWCFMRNAEVVATTREQVADDNGQTVIYANGIKPGTAATRDAVVPANVAGLLKQAVTKLAPGETVPFSQAHWNNIRELAGLIKRERAGRTEKDNMTWRKITSTVWQENILRHTGISYHFKLNRDIKETTVQAGNSPEVAFKHYIRLATLDEAKKFYAPISKTTSPARLADIEKMSA